MKHNQAAAFFRFCAVLLCAGALLLSGGLHAAVDEQQALPPLLVAKALPSYVDVSHYWVSEKLDGVRAIWDGKELRFRSGGRVAEPVWFSAKFPARPLDGELWFGRGGFDHLSGVVRKIKPLDEEWRQVRYMLFELPGAPGTFGERVEQMRAIVKTAQIPWLQAVEQFRVSDRQALQRHLSSVLKKQGEGLILHHADAEYGIERDDVLFKLKPWFDGDAVVVKHLPGQGKYEGMLGALLVEMPDGHRFGLGTGFSDAERRNPPAIGSQVIYRYRELNKSGLPRFASYLRVREAF
jgi:DNA ligase-1